MKPSMYFLLVTAVCLFACASSHPDSTDLTADLTDSHFETETEEAVDAAMDEPVDLVSPDGFLDGVFLDETEESQHALTVMSFNLRTGLAPDGDNAWKYREPIVLNVLAEHAPDLFGTQEGLIFQLMAIEDNLPEYDWLGIGRNGTEFEEFCAIFYKRERFEVLNSGTFWLSDTPDVPESQFSENQLCVRIVTWALLKDRETESTFHLFNTHFDTKSVDDIPERSAAVLVERIAEIAGDGLVLVTGDFNEPVGSKAWNILTGTMEYQGVTGSLLDPWGALGITEEGTFHAFTGVATSDRRIDWILHSSGFDPLSVLVIHDETDGHYPSDHFPVEATVEWTVEDH